MIQIDYEFRCASGYIGCGVVFVPATAVRSQIIRAALDDAYACGVRHIVAIRV